MSRPRSRGCPAAASRQPPTGTCSYQPLPIGLALLGSPAGTAGRVLLAVAVVVPSRSPFWATA